MEIGLQRVLSLLLTLAWVGGTQEVVRDCYSERGGIVTVLPNGLQALKTVALLVQIGLGQALDHTPLLWKGIYSHEGLPHPPFFSIPCL